MTTSAGKEVDEEDDYMNMTIAEPTVPKQKETYTQRRLRKEREAELKRPKSKAELAALAAEERDNALAQPLHASAPSSKGLKMMQQMGFQAGAVLGKEGNVDARSEPLNVNIKEDRGGIGLENEKKRKFQEEVREVERKKRVEEGEFRERVAREREEKRLEAMVGAAQKVAERLDGEGEHDGKHEGRDDGDDGDGDGDDSGNGDEIGEEETKGQTGPDKPAKRKVRPLSQVNLLYRDLLRHRAEKERERRARYDLLQSLSRLPTYEDPGEDEDDKRAMGRDDKTVVLEEELEDDDPELEEFQALSPAERLEKLVDYLRERWRYCFWCKYQYPDSSMEGCPGKTEEDHD
ncbi:MAG: hypothetical protein M1837_001353 [Sclerophora amabilis]|nr:MAG: hypothetical protein M1837_001353 [Sclerophora amabilis]